MRKDSLDRVEKALDKGPQTVSQLIKTTALSVQTVTQALAELGAERTNEWPARWTKGDSASRIPNLGTSEDQARVDVIRDPHWVDRWDRGRLRFGNDILGLTIKPHDKPDKLARTFAEGAAILASIALHLQEVQDDPDWFAQLSQENDEL